MTKKSRWFNYNESPIFNTFIHAGMLVKLLAAIGMIVGIWYFL
ncbi:MAG: hypothetical protein O3A78_02005 [Nitrospinae bacterium]|jgi:hypothetical protein|nr:hypothetical protein [Nitrospinota bacterium]MDA1108584.1 hypothetical protein [Nitrospinota bacterium]